VCFEQFVVPILRRLEGESSSSPFIKPKVAATLSRNVSSKEGREDFVRVRLQKSDGTWMAVPTLGKSGMVSSMARSHGYFQIPLDCEGMYRGDRVDVILFSNWAGEEFEKEYLFGHEASAGCAGIIPGASRPEKLSRI
jgi:molybdopterin molybdotransferase